MVQGVYPGLLAEDPPGVAGASVARQQRRLWGRRQRYDYTEPYPYMS
jgi:hypothetical protein